MEEEIEEIQNPSSYDILSGTSTITAPNRATLLKEFKKKPNTANSTTITPDQAPNINHEFDALNPGLFQCVWCKRIFKKEKARLIHSYSCAWQPDKIEVLSRMRLTRKEEKDKSARQDERLKRSVSGTGSSGISKYRRAPKRTPTIDSHETDQVPSSGSSPRSEASFDSTYLRAGNFDEIKAEFSRSKRRRLDAYRLIQKLKQDEHLMLKGDLKELAGGLYDADISMLDTRINQLEKENNKLKEIVSLREENRIMRARLADREKQQQKSGNEQHKD